MVDQNGQSGQQGGGEGGGSEGTAPSGSGPWYGGFADEGLRGFVESKQFESAESLARSYQGLEKLHGVGPDRLLTLPEDANAEGALDEIYAKLGRPEAPDNYTLALPDEHRDGVYAGMAQAAHKAGLNDKQFQALQGAFAEQMAAAGAQRAAQQNEALDAFERDNPDGFAAAKGAIAALGMDEAALDKVLSGEPRAIYEMLAAMGAKTLEGRSVDGGGDPGSMSVAGIEQRIKERMSAYKTGGGLTAAAAAELRPLYKALADAKERENAMRQWR